MQYTLKKIVRFKGLGLHSGKPVSLEVRPAPANSGICFVRSDLSGAMASRRIAARWDLVQQSPLCTRLINDKNVGVSTCEHIMAAIAGCGLHNLEMLVDGPEVPILDGSAEPFARAFVEAGRRAQNSQLQVLRVLKTVTWETAAGLARLSPSSEFRISFEIDFPDRAIGHQKKSMSLRNGHFLHELSDSRTFCRMSDVDAMRSNGLALGGTLDNAVVVEGARVLSPGGLRYADEAVRHKMLDAVGDLALAGYPILGHYTGIRAGHAMTNSLLRALFARPDAYRIETCRQSDLRLLPGFGIDMRDLPQVA